jgi:hypothetical protein
MEMHSADYGTAALDPDYLPGGKYYVEPDPLFDGNRKQRRRARAEHNKDKGKARVAAARRRRKDLEVVRKEESAVARGGRSFDREVVGTSASDRAAFEAATPRINGARCAINDVTYTNVGVKLSVSIF